MNYTDLTQFIPVYLVIVVAAIFVLGLWSKQSQIVPDKYITLVLLIFGITFAVLLDIINAQYKTMFEAIVYGVLHGILCWGVSVAGHQTFKQLQKEE